MDTATLVTLLLAAPLIVIALVSITNVLMFPRLGRSKSPVSADSLPHLSILIPARNESAVIGATVRALLAQDYPAFEVLVLDDDSRDGTADAARAGAEGDPRLRVLAGKPLPAGWLGKNWACHQLAEAATGEYLLFTDADVRLNPGALQALLNCALSMRADLLSVWPTQHTATPAERLVVPLMALAILGYLPILPVHHTRLVAFAAANGQCMLFRRRAYDQIGGHAGVRGKIVEDVTLARRIKAAGLRLRMADGAGLIACRMYTGWRAVRDGFAKNILAGHGDSLPFLAFSTGFHLAIFVLPWLWMLLQPNPAALALMVLGVGVRALTAAATRQRIADALLMPISALLMTRIAAQAVYWRLRFGGPRWKERTITRSVAHG